jgi:hypothetical protein
MMLLQMAAKGISAVGSEYFSASTYTTTMGELIRLAHKESAFQDAESEFMMALKSFEERLKEDAKLVLPDEVAFLRMQLEGIENDAAHVIDYGISHPEAFVISLEGNPVDVLVKYAELFDFYAMKMDLLHYYDY